MIPHSCSSNGKSSPSESRDLISDSVGRAAAPRVVRACVMRARSCHMRKAVAMMRRVVAIRGRRLRHARAPATPCHVSPLSVAYRTPPWTRPSFRPLRRKRAEMSRGSEGRSRPGRSAEMRRDEMRRDLLPRSAEISFRDAPRCAEMRRDLGRSREIWRL